MGIQIGQVLRQSALAASDRVALVDLGDRGGARRELTYAALDALALRVASRLRAAGVGIGDRVGLLAENSAECMASWFGIVYAGAAVVPLHVLSVAPELAQRLRHARCSAILHDDARAGLARQAAGLAGVAHVASLAEISGPGPEVIVRPEDMAADAAAMILYTSGTTGTPKGAVITHASLMVHTSVLSQRVLGLDAASVVLCVLPLSHSYGCRMAMLAPLFSQARIVVVPRFEAARTRSILDDEAVTWAPVVPTMLAAWAELPARAAAGALRWVLSAGAPLGDEIARRAEAQLGAEVRQGYGMTEATFSAINAPPDDRRFGCVGRPVWGVEVRIVDGDGRDVPAGARGEVLVRGHNVMSHYLDDAAASVQVRTGGFVHSGDIGQLDADGRLYIVDRSKDMIIRGGYNVYPAEVEAALAEHPSVAQVAVVGQPDAYYGEEIAAVVVLRASCTVESLAGFASERLGRMRRPRYFAFCDALPLGPSGKVHKRTLRTWIDDGRLVLQST